MTLHNLTPEEETELICLYMGLSIDEQAQDWIDKDGTIVYPEFDSDWNQLMPVMIKLNSNIKSKSGWIPTHEGIRIHHDTIYLQFGNFRLTNVVSEGKVEGRFKCLLDALYNAVVEFLNYKKNKDEQH